MFLEDPREKEPWICTLLVRTWAYRDRASTTRDPTEWADQDHLWATSGSGEAAKCREQRCSQEPQPLWLHSDTAPWVPGWPISMAWGKALDLETCASNTQEAPATHPFATITVQPRPSLPVAAAPDSGTTSYAQGQTSLSWVGARVRWAGSGDPHSHIYTPLPRTVWPRPLCCTRAGPRPTLCLGHSRSSINIYGKLPRKYSREPCTVLRKCVHNRAPKTAAHFLSNTLSFIVPQRTYFTKSKEQLQLSA